MDKYILQKALPGCGSVWTKAAVDKTFNGWFLMNTPQVSTGGVYSCCKNNSSKNQRGCNKIAVHFFSLQEGYPAWEMEFNRIPSKYMFMKISLTTAMKGGPCLFDPDRSRNYYEYVAKSIELSS
jgi:hypothetical protein